MRELSERPAARLRGAGVPHAGRASAAAQRRPEHRPDEPRRLLPQLPVRTGTATPPRLPASSSSKDESREIVYGMPYAEWQAEAPARGVTTPRRRQFEKSRPAGHGASSRAIRWPGDSAASGLTRRPASGIEPPHRRRGPSRGRIPESEHGRRHHRNQPDRCRRPAARLHRAHRAARGGEEDDRRRHQGSLSPRPRAPASTPRRCARIIRLRKKDQAERQEEEAILDLYKAALGMQ